MKPDACLTEDGRGSCRDTQDDVKGKEEERGEDDETADRYDNVEGALDGAGIKGFMSFALGGKGNRMGIAAWEVAGRRRVDGDHGLGRGKLEWQDVAERTCSYARVRTCSGRWASVPAQL